MDVSPVEAKTANGRLHLSKPVSVSIIGIFAILLVGALYFARAFFLPVIGSFAIIALSEGTRIWFGSMEGVSQMSFGLVLVICILFLPRGIEGVVRRRKKQQATADATSPALATVPGGKS